MSRSGGERGIRTLGRGLNPYNALAKRRFRPLSHLSVCSRKFRGKRARNKVQGGFAGENRFEREESVFAVGGTLQLLATLVDHAKPDLAQIEESGKRFFAVGANGAVIEGGSVVEQRERAVEGTERALKE